MSTATKHRPVRWLTRQLRQARRDVVQQSEATKRRSKARHLALLQAFSRSGRPFCTSKFSVSWDNGLGKHEHIDRRDIRRFVVIAPFVDGRAIFARNVDTATEAAEQAALASERLRTTAPRIVDLDAPETS